MSVFKRTSTGAAVAALMGLLAGCGGSSGGTNSGLPPDKAGGELTEDESEQLCDAFEETGTEAFADVDGCVATAYLASALLSTLYPDEEELRLLCETAQTDCEENGTGEPAAPACADLSDDCEATVGELEACFDDQVDASLVLLNPEEDCDTLTLDGLNAYMEDVGATAELTENCEAVAETCPEFFPE